MEHKKFKIQGIDCPDCALKVEKAVSKLEGVQKASFLLGSGELSVRSSDDVAPDIIETAVRRLGYDISELSGEGQLRTSVVSIPEMDCPNEFNPIEKKLKQLDGLIEAEPDYVARRLRVLHNPLKIHEEDITKTIALAGFESSIVEWRKALPPSPVRRRKLLLTIFSGSFFVLGLIFWALNIPQTYSTILYLAAMVSGGAYIARGAFYSVRNLSLDMNFLMTIAVIGAAIIGELTEGAATVFLFSLALMLESYSLDRARDAIRSLMDLAPAKAILKTPEGEKTVPVEEVKTGETVIVRPGDKIPVDGVVAAGTSEVDQSAITGESAPAFKEPGAQVFAGTLNRQGVLEVTASREVNDSTLSRIIALVEEAQAKKAGSHQFIDKFASVYTPIVIVLAACTWLLPWLVLELDAQEWLYRALVLLVISCPCALVISTPVTMVCGLGQAARSGVLIKGGIYLERMAKLDTVIFDKTGTLTTGRPKVSEVLPAGGNSPELVLQMAASVDARSEHHLGRAIVAEAVRRGVDFAPVEDFEAKPGLGATGFAAEKKWIVGKRRFFESLGVNIDEGVELLDRIESKGATGVLVGSEDGLAGVVAISDTVRPGARLALDRLRSYGIDEFVILTGDNEGAAKLVASELGISEYRANLLPEDKVSAVEEKAAAGKTTAMVGDGVNDAPALAASSLGIAMGTAGSDTALETADIALMADDLTKLTYAVRLGRKSSAIIRQNIMLAITLKLAFLVLAVAGLANLWMAVVADMGASLAVIFNGMRVLLLKHLPPGNVSQSERHKNGT